MKIGKVKFAPRHFPPMKPVAGLFLGFAAMIAAMPAAWANTVVIWPINPVIKAQDRAAALWLENPGNMPVTLQVQGLAWSQQDGKDVYAPQQEILATPALVTLQPKAKQLIRLTRLVAPPQVPERAYRLIVDEVPRAAMGDEASHELLGTEAGSGSGSGAGAGSNTSADRVDRRSQSAVNFRMRYSLPLFSYAANVEPANLNPAAQLSWRAVQTSAGPKIEISNQGQIHARLTNATLRSNGRNWELSAGLFGYVLPGRSIIFPLPDQMKLAEAQHAALSLSVNGAEAAALSQPSY